MPLILLAASVWAGGTMLGLGGVGVPVLLAGVTVLGCALAAKAVVGQAPRGELPLALLLLAGASVALGDDLRRADAQCRVAAREGGPWRVRLAAPAARGAFVRGELRGPGCRVRVALAVREGVAAAGATVRVVRAEPTEGPAGLLLRDAVLRLEVGPGPLDRWRNRVAASLDRRFGEMAPLVRALLIADTRGLAPEVRERFADAGLVHVLSISGLHVGIVGGALLLLAEALRLPLALGRVLAVALAALYVLAIGAPPAATRSVTLFAAVSLTRLCQRPVSPWGSFALAALMPLAEPRTVLALGWQLSVAGYAGVIAAGRWCRRVLPAGWRGWRSALATDLAVGVLTTLTTAPLVAWHFGRLSLVSPVSNLAAGPVVALLQPTLFAAMLMPLPGVADFLADASWPLLTALDTIASAAASLPGAALVVAPTRLNALVAGAGVLALVVATCARRWAPPACVAAGCAAWLAWLAWAPAMPAPASGAVEVHAIDVGQGDAIAVRTPRGRWVLVDAGRTWAGGDAGRASVLPYLRRQGGALALFVLTHPHADHVGGAASVVAALKPPEVRDAAFVAGSPAYRAMLHVTRRAGSRWQRVRPGEVLDVDGVAFEFLAPDSAWAVGLSDPNAASTVVRVRYGAFAALLTGDAEAEEEAWLLARDPAAVRATVLKVGHHGSRTSSTPDFVDAVAPRIALVSVGAGNGYGLPNADVLERLVDAGATVLRTDQLGSIVVRSDGVRVELRAAGLQWALAELLPGAP